MILRCGGFALIKAFFRWVRGEPKGLQPRDPKELAETITDQAQEIQNLQIDLSDQNESIGTLMEALRSINTVVHGISLTLDSVGLTDLRLKTKAQEFPRQNPSMCSIDHVWVKSFWQCGGRGEPLCATCGHIEGGDCHNINYPQQLPSKLKTYECPECKTKRDSPHPSPTCGGIRSLTHRQTSMVEIETVTKEKKVGFV